MTYKLREKLGRYVSKSVQQTMTKPEQRMQSCQRANYEQLIRYTGFFTFVAKALKLSWKMIIQQPPMSFVYEPQPMEVFDSTKHKATHHAMVDPKEAEVLVDYFVHPALVYDDTIMKRARVVCIIYSD